MSNDKKSPSHNPVHPGPGYAPLPLARIIRKHELPTYCGLRRTVIAEMIAKGEFPKPVKLNDAGRILGWLETEIVAWQRARIALRDAGASPEPKYRPIPPPSTGRPSKRQLAAERKANVAARTKRRA